MNRIVLRKQYVYYLAFAIYCIGYALNYTTFREISQFQISIIYQILRIISALLLILLAVTRKYDQKQMVIIIFGSIIILFSVMISGSWNIALIFLFVITGHKADIKKLAKICIAVYVSIMSIAYLASSTGMISNVVLAGSDLSRRYSWGFIHPNTLAMFCLIIGSCFSVLYFRNFKLWHILVYAPLIYLSWFVAISKTSTFCFLILIVFSILLTIIQSKTFDRIFLRAGYIGTVFLCLFSIYLMAFYDPSIEWMSELNLFLSSRIRFMNVIFSNYPPSLFGYDFENTYIYLNEEFTSFLVDNSYAHVLLESGILCFLLLFSSWIITLRRATMRKKLTDSVFGLIVFSIVAFSETAAAFFCTNIFLIAIAYVFNDLASEDSAEIYPRNHEQGTNWNRITGYDR